MNLQTVFFRDLSRTAFDSLAEYFAAVESQWASQKAKDHERIYRDVKGLGLSVDDEYTEYNLAMQEHSAKYDMLFTNFSRYSFVVLLFLVLEDWLHRLCLAVKDVRRGLAEPRDPQGDTIETYRQYLNDAGVLASDTLWECVSDFRVVRNCVVHSSGNVGRRPDKHKRKLKHVAANGIGIRISGAREDLDDLEPLYMEDDMLIIEPKYCISMIATIKSLFEELCDAVPLHKLNFTSFTQAGDE